jgi:hypothetical protein
MKKNIRCEACGRKRKPGHEKRCGTKKAYSEKCQKYEVVKAEIDKKKEAEKKARKEKVAVEV